MASRTRRDPASFRTLLSANVTVLAVSACLIVLVWLAWRWLGPLFGATH